MKSHGKSKAVLTAVIFEVNLLQSSRFGDAQRWKRPRVEKLIRSRTRDAQRRRELIGIQHRRQIFVVVVHV